MEQVLETYYKVVDDAANAAVMANGQKIWGMVSGIRREMNKLALSTNDTEEARRLVRRYTREQTKLIGSDEGVLIRGFKCGKCDKHFMKAFQYAKHLRTNHKIQVKGGFQCQLCDFSQETVQAMVNHLMKSHVSQDEQSNIFYECPKSGMKFLKGINEDMLRTYIVYTDNYCNFEEQPAELTPADRQVQIQKFLQKVRHSSSGDYYCAHCQDTFNSTHSLAKHFMKETKMQAPNYYFCPKCFEFFKQSGSLANHLIESHGKEGTFKCPEKGQRFKSVEELSKHIKKTYHYSTFFTTVNIPPNLQKKYET